MLTISKALTSLTPSRKSTLNDVTQDSASFFTFDPNAASICQNLTASPEAFEVLVLDPESDAASGLLPQGLRQGSLISVLPGHQQDLVVGAAGNSVKPAPPKRAVTRLPPQRRQVVHNLEELLGTQKTQES